MIFEFRLTRYQIGFDELDQNSIVIYITMYIYIIYNKSREIYYKILLRIIIAWVIFSFGTIIS